MATLGLLLSFAIAALLYGRGLYDGAAAVLLILGSTTIFAFSSIPVWLMLMLPVVPVWFEAIFRLKHARQRQNATLVFTLTSGIALVLLPHLLPAEFPLAPSTFYAIHAVLLLCLELKTYSLPAIFQDRPVLQRLNTPLSAGLSVIATSLALAAWFRAVFPDVNYLLALSLGTALLHEATRFAAHRVPGLTAIFQSEISLWLPPAAIVWSAALSSLIR